MALLREIFILYFVFKIPEERVPWEPLKSLPSKPRSKSVPARKTETLPTIEEKDAVSTSKKSTALKTTNLKNIIIEPNITISRGALKLAVNFPSDAFVKFRNGKKEKKLIGEMCYCKQFFVSCQ